MRILFINTTGGTASHGRIAFELAKEFEKEGHECKIAYGRNPSSTPDFLRMGVQIGNVFDISIAVFETRIFDNHGFSNTKSTKHFLEWAEKYNPDLLWLHNIHGYYINVELLFEWIKKRPDMQVNWTLHDCWAFTGHCGLFTIAKCEKWKQGCDKCPQIKEYPGSLLVDNSRENYQRKKNAFIGVKKLTIITPSQWLAELVKQSFLGNYPIEVKHNQIDTNIFKPTPSDFREKYGLQDKIVILGVANVWHERKGLKDFIELAKRLDDRYTIVLVGLSKRQLKELPKSIIGLTRTASAAGLAGIYTMSDVYVNPSNEETFGMTTVESEACGTQAIVYQNATCEEIVHKLGGVAIPQNVGALYEEITKNHKSSKSQRGGVTLILLGKTQNAQELAELYTMADYFVNPTHEDNYPTTNLEAQACGTWTITYNVGGSKETLM